MVFDDVFVDFGCVVGVFCIGDIQVFFDWIQVIYVMYIYGEFCFFYVVDLVIVVFVGWGFVDGYVWQGGWSCVGCFWDDLCSGCDGGLCGCSCLGVGIQVGDCKSCLCQLV